MKHERRGGMWSGLLLAVAVVGLSGPASMGQFGTAPPPRVELKPPTISPPREPETLGFLTMGWVGLLILLAIGAALIPTKRGHQD